MSAVHFRVGFLAYACGVGPRWSSQNISSTWGRHAVTCRNCLRTKVFTGGPL